MDYVSFFLGASLVAVCVAVWRAIVASDKRFIEREVRRKKHAHEHIDINADRREFRDDIDELIERVERLEKSELKFHEWFSTMSDNKRGKQ